MLPGSFPVYDGQQIHKQQETEEKAMLTINQDFLAVMNYELFKYWILGIIKLDTIFSSA